MRLIDADELMATLSHNCYPVQHDMTSIEPGMTLMGMLQAIQEQPTIEPQRWIPCSERLPEPEMKVLVTLIDHRRQKINMNWNGEKRYSIRIDKIVKYTPECKPFWAKGNTPSVIAWMPLPEAYKGEGRDDEQTD